MPKNFCKTCGFRAPGRNVCSLTRLEINPDKDFCSHYCDQTNTCDLCGNLFIDSPYIDITNPNHLFMVCSECKAYYHRCQTCAHASTCAFETDPSPLPKVVRKQVRKGNMVTVTMIRNPERIAITCAKSCTCFKAHEECSRDDDTCPNYRFVKETK